MKNVKKRYEENAVFIMLHSLSTRGHSAICPVRKIYLEHCKQQPADLNVLIRA